MMDSKLHKKDPASPEADFSLADAREAAGTVACLRLSGGKSEAMRQTLRIRMSVPGVVAAELERVCRNSPFLTWTAFLAGTALYLSRYARATSVAIAGPERKDGALRAHGPVFPVLLQVDGHSTFREYMQYCRAQLSALYLKRPSRVKELLDAGFSTPGSACPFQIGVAHASLHTAVPVKAAELRIMLEQSEHGSCLDVEFNPSLFSSQAVDDLLRGQFELLRQGLSNPDRHLSELSLIVPADAKALCAQQEQERDTQGEDFLDLFEHIAERQPNAIAVRENDTVTSYAGLNACADRLAAVLLSRGIRNEEVVGVAMNRTAAAIAAILGIWKAGAVYLPCDPNLPSRRLSQMIEDSGARLVLTDRDLPDLQPPGVTFLHTNQLDATEGLDGEARRLPRDPGRLAYIIYTSGSTGRPKGVELSHRGLASLVHAQRRVFTDEECRNVLQFSAHSFDASVFDIAMALGHGGTLHMSGGLQIPTGDQLFAVLHDQRITLATIPPCVLATLPGGDLPSLRTLVVAGEACPQALADQWSNRVRFVNAYGPTETTVWATFEECLPGSKITIGVPIPGCRAHILDQYLQPVPPGCPGELCLTGENLARGFLGMPALTAQLFVPNPLAGVPGERLYRTGDLAALGVDGRLEFIGRADNQHKIRGYRIELGEIENVLCTHPELEQAAVIVKDGPGSSKTILAFAVAKGHSQPAPSVLREFASERLPEYMVPSQFVLMAEMPLTRSGKVDRRRLLELDATAKMESTDEEKPEGHVEEVLAAMWAELLNREKVGPQENFFSLGGHSLLAIQVVSRIKKLFAVTLHARTVFNAPTVRALSQRVQEGMRPQQPEPEMQSECNECICSLATPQ